MKINLKKIKASDYLHNIITLSFGTMLAQLVLVLASPLLTRIYLPEQLGAFTIMLTIVSMFAPIINGRYDMSIVTADTDQEADAVTVTGILICLLLSVCVGVGLIFYLYFKPDFFETIGMWIFLAVPMLIVTGIENLLASYNNRYKQYNLLSSVTIIRALTQGITQIGFGLLNFGILGLILSQFISLLVGLKRQTQYAVNNFERFKVVKLNNIKTVFLKYINQLLYSAPALFMNTLAYSIIVFFVASLYGVKEVGYYSISFRVLGLPIALISTNVSRVFFQRASDERRTKGSFYSIFVKTALILVTVSLPFFILLMYFSKDLFGFIFGKGWEKAGGYVAILLPMFAVRFVVASLSLTFTIGKKQKHELMVQAGFMIGVIFSYIISKILRLNIECFLGMISGSFFINYIIMFLTLLNISKEKIDLSINVDN